MEIPKYDELLPVVLQVLSGSNIGTINWKDLESPCAKHFNLEPDDLAQEYNSGNGRVFIDRIGWALSHLAISKLVERPKRGYCRISDLGRTLVGDDSKIKDFVKDAIAEHYRQRQEAKNVSSTQEAAILDSEVTPDEALSNAALSIRNKVYEEILDTILTKTPYEFEKLVVRLLCEMGYGGVVKDSGMVTQQSNDGGIDGIIKEDHLGLGRINIQAKRYKRDNLVGRQDIQNFVGALAVVQSNKGVFITTSGFTKQAIEYAESLTGATTIVLIDGLQLAEYIYDFGLGMQTESTIVIKRMDSDFWETMQDQSSN